MIKSIASVLVLLAILTVPVFAEKSTVISGSLPETISGEVTVKVDLNYLHVRPQSYKTVISNHRFSIAIPLDRNRVVEVENAAFKFYIYLNPGDSLQLDLKFDPTTTVLMSGNVAEENKFLQAFFGKFNSDFSDSLYESKLPLSIDEYEGFVFSVRKQERDFIKADPAYSGLSASFKMFIENQILYNYWLRLFSYPIINANKSAQILTVKPIPDVMLDEFSKIKYDNPEAMICQSYLDFLKYYVIYETSKANGYNKFTDYSISADRKMAVANEKLSEPTYVYWASRFCTEECERLSAFITKKLYNSIQEKDKAKVFAPAVAEMCGAKLNSSDASSKSDEKKKPEAKGGDDFSGLDLTDENGNSVSLSSYKGKVVYIDFWASWCGPCRMMMPFSKQLHEQLTDKEKKQIIFLYISIDADQGAWKKAMSDLGIEGEKVISPGNWKSKACSFFQINSIPRYMIMNKKGKIVDFNAKRPADNAVLDELRQLLSE